MRRYIRMIRVYLILKFLTIKYKIFGRWEDMMTEQDRQLANDYHYANYERIYNADNLAEAKAIALEEMKIICDDKEIELADDDQSAN